MDKIIENLTRDYKSSIDFFNHADYNHFFSDIRLSIEWFLKRMFFQTRAKVVKFRFIVNKKRKL